MTILGRTVDVINSEVIGFGLRNTETNFRFIVITSSQLKHFQMLGFFSSLFSFINSIIFRLLKDPRMVQRSSLGKHTGAIIEEEGQV